MSYNDAIYELRTMVCGTLPPVPTSVDQTRFQFFYWHRKLACVVQIFWQVYRYLGTHTKRRIRGLRLHFNVSCEKPCHTEVQLTVVNATDRLPRYCYCFASLDTSTTLSSITSFFYNHQVTWYQWLLYRPKYWTRKNKNNNDYKRR